MSEFLRFLAAILDTRDPLTPDERLDLVLYAEETR